MDACPEISIYVKCPILKGVLGTQLALSLLSMVVMVLTARRIFHSACLDGAFKEYIVHCYVMLVIENLAGIALSVILFTLFFFWPTCQATVPNWFCNSLKFIKGMPMFGLPLIGFSLTLLRVLTFSANFRNPAAEKLLHRCLALICTLVILGEQYWKYYEFEWSSEPTAYCTAASKMFATKNNIESGTVIVVEVANIMLGWVLLVSTMRLFLPYSVFHLAAFLLSAISTPILQFVFVGMPESEYSTTVGYFFVSMKELWIP
ncbi:unnamed protein product, partial [Mesorhabditis spiculigera]